MLTLTTFTVLTRCLGFLYKIYMSRIMTTTELGIYNLSLSVFMVLLTIVGASIPLTISKITALNASLKNQNDTHHSITASLILTSSLSIFLSLLILISKPLLTLIIGDSLGYEIIIYLIPSLIFTAIYSQIRGYLWGIENYFSVSIVEFVEQILRIGFCVIFVSLNIFKSQVIAVSLAMSIACGISTFYGIYLYKKNGGKFKYKRGYFKDIIKSSIPLTAVRLFGSIIQPLITIIIPIRLASYGITKNQALSELGITMGMTMPLLSIPSTIIGALCMILVPRINNCRDKNNQDEQINYYIKFTISCIFAFIPIFICLGLPICQFVYENSTAGMYLQYSCWIMIPLGLSQITTSILNALNQENKTFIYYIISSIFLFILILILPKYFGILSLIYATGISTGILFILNMIKLNKLFRRKISSFNLIITHTLLTLPILLVTKYTYNILDIIIPKFFSIGFTCIISILSYLALLFIFNILEYKKTKNLLFSIFYKKKSIET